MRVLISIGCDEYHDNNFGNLHGAVNDARAIFNALIEEQDTYDHDKSVLLQSPTIADTNKAIQDIIFTFSEDLELSIFFAGHGAVKNGAYFMLLKDSLVDRLSATSLGLSDVFTWINEANVTDTNIVIDACQSGGAAYDISTYLRPDNIGNLGSPSITIFAASAADQYAMEVNNHGIATDALLKCLTGKTLVQSDHEFLNLIEVGHSISETFKENDQQTPVYWGMNLFGRSTFSKNPHYSNTHPSFISLTKGLNKDVEDSRIIRKFTKDIWETYLASSNYFDSVKFFDLTKLILKDLPQNSSAAPTIVNSLSISFKQVLNESKDPYELVELLATCITTLLPYVDHIDNCDYLILDLAEELSHSIHNANLLILSSIRECKYALLSDDHNLSDMYYLPIKISRLLGWIGIQFYIYKLLGIEFKNELEPIKELINTIINIYTHSIAIVSEEQTSFILVFLFIAKELNLDEESEQIFGLLLHSYSESSGKISLSMLEGSEAYKFTQYCTNELQDDNDLLSYPSEFLSTLIVTSYELDLSDLIDTIIKKFDHTPINIFIPDNYQNFSEHTINEGTNYTSIIGNGIWCTKDLINTIEHLKTKISHDQSLNSDAVKIAAICSSFILPNRVPWFLYI